MLITAKADIRPPSAPVLGSPTAVSSSALTVPLSSAATDTGSLGAGVASYALERATSPTGPFSVLSSSLTSASFPYSDTGLTAATAYYYRLVATDNSGNVGAYSGIASQTTLAGGGADPLAFRSPTGTDKFVDFSAGSDGSGSDASPWNTLSLARLQSLTAGQSLWFKNGSGSASWTPIAATSGLASGNSANRITLACYPGHNKTRWNFPAIGAAYAMNYWDIREQDFRTSQTGFRLGWNSWDGNAGDFSADHVRIIDCVGTKTGETQTDNSGIITFATGGGGTATNIGIYRCSLTGPAGSGVTNRSLIWSDHCDSFEIIGCLLDGSSNPIYLKHLGSSSSSVSRKIQNCILRNAGRAALLSTNYLQYLNNVHDACDMGLDEDGGSPAGTGSNTTISHCTFKDSTWFCAADSHIGSANNTSRNNVSSGTSKYFDNPSNAISTGSTIDYSACSASMQYRVAGNNYTASNFHASFPASETNIQTGTVTYVGGASPGSVASNWALAVSSIGRGNASDGGDRGVDATKLLAVQAAAF